MEIQRGRGSLDYSRDRRKYHSVIEAACFLKGRMMASHSKDAQRTADEELIRKTWDVLQTHAPTIRDSHLEHSDMDQLQAFLVGPSEIKHIINMSESTSKVIDSNAAPPTPSRSFTDDVLTANTDTSIHTSFNEDQHVQFPALAGEWSDQTEFPTDSYPARSQTVPSQFPLDAADLQFMPSPQQYRVSCRYNDDFDAFLDPTSSWHDAIHSYGTPGQLYSGVALTAPALWNIDPQDHHVLGSADPTQSLAEEKSNIDLETALISSRYTQRTHTLSDRATSSLNRSTVSRDTRRRRRPTTLKAIVPTLSTVVADQFVNESPAAVSNSPHKRMRAAEAARTETPPMNYRFERPVEAGGIEGKTREKLLREEASKQREK